MEKEKISSMIKRKRIIHRNRIKIFLPDHIFRHTGQPESITPDELLIQLREDYHRKNYHIIGIELSKNGEVPLKTFVVKMSAAVLKQMLEDKCETRKFLLAIYYKPSKTVYSLKWDCKEQRYFVQCGKPKAKQ